MKDQDQLLKNQNESLRCGKVPEAVKKRVLTQKSKGKLIPAHILQIMSKTIGSWNRRRSITTLAVSFASCLGNSIVPSEHRITFQFQESLL